MTRIRGLCVYSFIIIIYHHLMHHIVPWTPCIPSSISTSHSRVLFCSKQSQLDGSEIRAHYTVYSQRRWRDILASPRSEWRNSWGHRWWEGKKTSRIRWSGILPVMQVWTVVLRPGLSTRINLSFISSFLSVRLAYRWISVYIHISLSILVLVEVSVVISFSFFCNLLSLGINNMIDRWQFPNRIPPTYN